MSENVVNGINLALKTAADEWGKYGPVEYWVFGADKLAALDLINKFCEMIDDHKDECTPTSIQEKDIQNLVHICSFFMSKK